MDNRNYTEFTPPINDQPVQPDLKTAKKNFSKIGLALCLTLLVNIVADVAVIFASQITNQLKIQLPASVWTWVLALVPYIVAMPFGMIVMRSIPSVAPEREKIGFGSFLLLIPITVFLTNAGNYIGTFLSALLSRNTATDSVDILISNVDYTFMIVALVIVAPIFEELFFRKMIIDKTKGYGELTAILFSSLLFALFHMNLYQFFYTFMVGTVFGFIYMRTGNIVNSIVLHALLNFNGSVVASYFQSKVDLVKLNEIMSNDFANDPESAMTALEPMLPGLTSYLLYSLFLSALSIAGLIILIVKRKKIIFKKSSLDLPKGTVASTVYMNAGIILFVVISTVLTLLTLFSNQLTG